MSVPTSLPSIDEIKDFPKNPKAQMIISRGYIRVIERQYFWNKEKQRGCEKRIYLGYVVDNVYYSNDTYRQIFDRNGAKRLLPSNRRPESMLMTPISAMETRQAAEIPLYYAISKETGLVEDLTAVWGSEAAKAMLSIAFHWLNSSSNAAYLYASWSEGMFLPYDQNLSGKKMTEFFKAIVKVPNWRKDFFGRRLARLADHELISFDATEIATEAQEISYAQFGKGKEGGYQKQLGLVLLVGHESRMPVLFRMLPGNITDVTTVQDMLFRFDEISLDRRVFGCVVDRGYFSLDNLAKFVDAGSNVLMAAKTDVTWIMAAMEEAMTSMWLSETRIPGHDCWGKTIVLNKKFDDGIYRKLWVHVYRSEMKSSIETKSFYNDLEKFESDWKAWRPSNKKGVSKKCPLTASPWIKYFLNNKPTPGTDTLVRDHEAIDVKLRYAGFFCNVTTMECTASQALSDYKGRDIIEKSFKGGKSNFELDEVRSHFEDTAESRFVVGMVAMTVLNEIYLRMSRPSFERLKTKTNEIRPLSEETTFNEIKNRLRSIRVIYDGNGKRHWQEITTRQQKIVERLGCPELFKSEPSW